jgi:ceramide glucosyltransferase
VELLCGVASPDDPAVAVVAALQAEFPARSIHLVVCPEQLGASGKVSTLVQLVRHARHEYLLASDGDILVPAGYLARVMEGFADASVGMVTALYRGCPGRTLWSRLESMTISTDFQPGVLTALLLERGMRFALGSTLAVRRVALEAIGGFESLLDLLADDYELGARIYRAGFSLVLAPVVVETAVPDYRWRTFLAHQLRWLRTVRDSRRWGYVGLLFTHPVALAALGVLASGASFWSVWLLVLALLLRLSLALQVGVATLGDRALLGDLWLLPLRDLLAFALWLSSFASDEIEWRGHRYLLKNGRLTPLE